MVRIPMLNSLSIICSLSLIISFANIEGKSPRGNPPAAVIYSLDGGHFILSDGRSPKTAEISVRGKVTDESNQPLPGVSILVKGTNNGTTSDTNGDYSLTVADQNSVLVFSFIGYATQEVSIDNRTSINITLKEELISLSEVVVTGYGTQSKRDITGAVATID